MTVILSPSERSYIVTGLAHPTSPTRLDGRQLHQSRAISISYGDAPQASGSARVVLGGTEVLAGIRVEVGDEGEDWRCRVEVDVTPQAYPQLQSSALSLMSTQLASIISDHFVPSIPPIPIVPPSKHFIPHLHLTLLSASGNIATALVLAARAAFQDLRIPQTKVISTGPAEETDEQKDLSGIKAAIRTNKAGGGGRGKGKGAARGAEWELDLKGDGTKRLDGREKLPVLVTLNLIPDSEAFFLDAGPQEEIACPDRLHVFFDDTGRICGIRMEGESGLDAARIRPLLKEAQNIAANLFESLDTSSTS